MSHSSRPLLGFGLSLVTVFCWGLLPLALKQLLKDLDPLTITWARFLVAALIVGVRLKHRQELPSVWKASGFFQCMFLGTVVGLLGNYVVYLMGLRYVSPGTAQLVVQLAPMTLLLGSLVFYKESFSKVQAVGVVLFFLGLLMFFDKRLNEILSGTGEYAFGVGLVVAAAVLWGGYALAQKSLLRSYTSHQILFVVYLASGILLSPIAKPSSILELSGLQWFVLGFCCLNTLLAYGAFAEAMAVWDSSRVSAVLTITPVATLVFSAVAASVWPGQVQLPALGGWALPGAGVIVLGSMLAALGKKQNTAVMPVVVAEP